MSVEASEAGQADGLAQLQRVPARKIPGKTAEVLRTGKKSDFATVPCEALDLTFDGIEGDRHGGRTRRSGGREPWYPRGTVMANERQLSILSAEELALIASRMELDALPAGWIGGNVVTQGIPSLSLLPPRTRLVFESGAVLRVDGYNPPCRAAGRKIAENVPGREGLDLLFPKTAQYLRGLVAFVELPGRILPGDAITAHLPEHWIYPG
ncbi:MOSC domain-containing protein [Pannonibacter phragmitetus]|uniref:MOSC domain-containing protein n=1 Tax=Pannonibacter phragmitetus TaxID=121719 RepID=UPI003D2F1DE0